MSGIANSGLVEREMWESERIRGDDEPPGHSCGWSEAIVDYTKAFNEKKIEYSIKGHILKTIFHLCSWKCEFNQ